MSGNNCLKGYRALHIGANQGKRGFNYLESEFSVQYVKLEVFGVREFISELIRAI